MFEQKRERERQERKRGKEDYLIKRNICKLDRLNYLRISQF